MTLTTVGLREDGERLLVDAAVSYAAKAPLRVILYSRSLIVRFATSANSGD